MKNGVFEQKKLGTKETRPNRNQNKRGQGKSILQMFIIPEVKARLMRCLRRKTLKIFKISSLDIRCFEAYQWDEKLKWN